MILAEAQKKGTAPASGEPPRGPVCDAKFAACCKHHECRVPGRALLCRWWSCAHLALSLLCDALLLLFSSSAPSVKTLDGPSAVAFSTSQRLECAAVTTHCSTHAFAWALQHVAMAHNPHQCTGVYWVPSLGAVTLEKKILHCSSVLQGQALSCSVPQVSA